MQKFWSIWFFLITILISTLIKPTYSWAQVVQLPATEDSSVNEEDKTANMNSRSFLLVGVEQQGAIYNRAYSYVKFNLSGLPSGMEISKANLTIYLSSASGLSPVDLKISRATSSWRETTLTWNNMPSVASPLTISSNNTTGTKKFDITNIVKYWQNNASQNFGIQIAPAITNQSFMRNFADLSGRNLYIETTYYNPTDHTPPVISNIKATPSKTTAEITWISNELLKEAFVEFGTTGTLGKKVPAISIQSNSLQVNLTGLKSSTPYFYKISSVDFAGNTKTQTGTFNTLGSTTTASTTLVQLVAETKTISSFIPTNVTISNLKATDITYKSALITWDTNIATNSLVEYGKSQRTLDKQKSSTSLVTKHSVKVEGLASNTRYYYMVKSGGPSLHTASFPPGDPQIFLTKTPTAAESAAEAQIGRDAANQIMDDLNNIDTSFGFGTNSQSGTTTTSAGTTSAVNNSLVIYDPRITDPADDSVTARWVTNKSATSQVYYWRPGFYANSIGNTTHVTNHVLNLFNLEPNSQYNYFFRSLTNRNESSVSPVASFRTKPSSSSSTATLSIEGLGITSITQAGAVFVWTTNKPANELLIFTDTSNNYARFKDDHTFQTQHTQTLTNLTPDAVYLIKLTAATQTGETKVVTSQFRAFTTLDSSTTMPVGPVGGDSEFDSSTPPDLDTVTPDEYLPQGDEVSSSPLSDQEVVETQSAFVDPQQILETQNETPQPDAPSSSPENNTKIIPPSILGGFISQIPIIKDLFQPGSSSSKPDLTKVLLILLVIILILVILLKKVVKKVPQNPPAEITVSKTDAVPAKTNQANTDTTKTNPAEAVPAKINQPEVTEKIIAPKPKKRSWLVILILFVLAIMLVQGLGFFINPAILLAPLMDQVIDPKSPSVKSDISLNYLEGSGPNLSVKKIDSSLWPAGSQGGVFEISPSGDFKNLAKLTITLDKPIPGFTLGYWYPDTKKWIRIPTIRRSGFVYEGYLTHASVVAGSTVLVSKSSISDSQSDGVAGSGEFSFRDPSLVRDWQQITNYLKTLQQRSDQGGGGVSTDSTWNLIESILSRMSSVVINNCRSTPSLLDRVEFLQVMSLAQLYGFDNVFQKFNSAWSSCIPLSKEVQTSSYIIKQTDKIPYNYNFTGIGKASGESTIISDGVVIKEGKGFGWQGDWQVVQNTTSSGQTYNQLNMGGLTSSGISSTTNVKDLTMLLFSLNGVSVGSEFPLYIVRIGTYEADTTGPTQDLIFALNNKVFGTSRVTPDSKTILNKGGLEIKAKLVESYGKDGALISLGQGGMGSIAGQQGEAIKQIGQMAEGNPALKKLFDEMMAQSSAEIKLKLIPSGI